jgi:hypothetical protein
MAKHVFLCLLAAFLTSIGTPASSKPKISLIVDNTMTIPGGTTPFALATFTYGEINDGKVVFATEDQKVWSTLVDGKRVQLLLDDTTPIPGTSGLTFAVSNGGWVQIVGDTVVVAGVDNNDNMDGYYSLPRTGGAFTDLFDQSDLGQPLGDPNFHVNTDANGVGQMIFTIANGSVSEVGLVPVAGGTATIMPPALQPYCCNYGSADLSGGTVALEVTNGVGSSSVQSVAEDGDATTYQILAQGDLPGFCKAYFSVLQPQSDGNTVVFRFINDTPGSVCPNNGDQGILALNGGQATILADINTPIPHGTGTFNADCSFRSLAARDGQLVFLGCDANQDDGIYAVPETGGTVKKLIARGDTIGNGLVVNDVAIGPEPISHGIIVILVYVFPQYYGLYAASLDR